MQCLLVFRYCLLKLASSDTSRVLDSWSALVTRINTLTFNTFQRNMQPYIDRVNEMTDKFSSEETYSYFLNKVIICKLLCTCVVCLCVCVCVHVHIYVCMCAVRHTHICTFIYMCVCLLFCLSYLCMHVYVGHIYNVCVRVCVRVCV